MGAGQSANAGHSVQDAESVKTSYYELLAVDKQATEEEIKKAYRRKALELHPDRNYGDVERTTALFAEIQAAYEVLSDPQERAWYDSHEDAILHGGDPTTGGGGEDYEHNVGLTTADDITRLLGRFNGGVAFTDAPSGFFGYLRDTFEKLAKEETRAAYQQDLDPIDYPSFGHKDDNHEDVVRTFYASWAGFSTRKSFSWRDKYSTRDAEDRRMRRLIEKENKRFRDEGIREFNDAVRSLVAFVRKRDPRYRPNTQSEEERQKALRDATAAQASRMRAANQAKMDAEVVPDWAKAREPDELEEEEEEESEEEHFECLACRKTFKSENQFEAHEKSKKHQKAVQALRRKLQKEGVQLDLDAEESANDADIVGDNDATLSDRDHGTSDHLEEPKLETADVGDVTHETSRLDIKQHATDEEDSAILENENPTTPDSIDSESGSETSSRSPNRFDSHPSQLADSTIQQPIPQPASAPKMGKAAKKRAKKAAQQQQDNDSASEQAHKCAVCNAPFPSKTRLFQHIKDFKHAAPVSPTKGKVKKGK